MKATTWLDLKNRCLRLLQDTARDAATYTDEDMVDYVNSALVDVAAHTARKKTQEIVLEEPATTLSMPDDFMANGPVAIQVQGLYWQLWQPITWHPDETLPTPYSFSLSSNAYYEWPKGTLNFLWLVPANTKLRLQYYAYWEEVEDDSSVFTFRHRWLIDALQWNILSKACLKIALQAANLRQYNIKVDSGVPEDNPMLKVSREFYRKFLDKLAENPPQDRSLWMNGD
jgi:hypothetical protein